MADRSTFAEAWEIVRKYQLTEKATGKYYSLAATGVSQSKYLIRLKPGDPLFNKSHNYLIGTNRIALEAAVAMAKELHYTPVIITR